MYLISVPNLKEIHPGEGCFFWLKVIALNRCKEEEKYEENLETNISADFLKFSMPSHVYGGHKICKFDRNRSSSYRDTRC